LNVFSIECEESLVDLFW